MPRLPKQKELLTLLAPYHAKLVGESYLGRKRPIYECTDVQVYLFSVCWLTWSILHLQTAFSLLLSSSDCLFAWLCLITLFRLQVEAAKGFLEVLRNYLDSLCCNLRSHTITNVQSNDDKVCYHVLQNIVGFRYFCFFFKYAIMSWMCCGLRKTDYLELVLLRDACFQDQFGRKVLGKRSLFCV